MKNLDNDVKKLGLELPQTPKGQCLGLGINAKENSISFFMTFWDCIL